MFIGDYEQFIVTDIIDCILYVTNQITAFYYLLHR